MNVSFDELLICFLLCLAELLLPPQLLCLLGLFSILLFHQLPVRLHTAVTFTDECHKLSYKLIALLPRLLSGLLVLLLHGSLLPAVGGLPRVILLLPSKVLTSAEALPEAVKHVHYLK